MDYKTKPTSRKILRNNAKIFRQLFGFNETEPFDPLIALEKLPDVFTGCTYQIIDDDEFDRNVSKNEMSFCVQNYECEGYSIYIRESVYTAAYRYKDGAKLGFICHELCHVYLLSLGFSPLSSQGYPENVIPAYCSMEWQAKALSGEVMLPYEATIGMTAEEMINEYQVSRGFADTRLRLE